MAKNNLEKNKLQIQPKKNITLNYNIYNNKINTVAFLINYVFSNFFQYFHFFLFK